ncbi:MAG: T9SS type A sorting domain-containing protein, partial [Ignavibacteria bacterium]|nr:T9SS type A sorting domain-containing protein [Ignavibacteria bacterium]
INFSIPKSGYVKLVVYDMMGRVAAEPVNGNYSAGTYKVDFDASKLSSGTYFYKINTDEFTLVKKMTLVK